MNCLIVDDEPAARNILETYIADVPGLTVIGSSENALEAGQILDENSTDILFLDINMPKLSGIEFLKTLSSRPQVVLTTAYSEYALEGFELDVVDYLLKPFSFERFLKAVEKCKSTQKSGSVEESWLTVKADGKWYRIAFDEILYAESNGDYITLYSEENKLTFYQTLKSFLKSLPKNQFIQVHKSFVVSLQHVRYLEGNQLSVGDKHIPIGKSYRAETVKRFTNQK